MLTAFRHFFVLTMIMAASCLYSLQAKAIANDDITIITIIPFDDLVIPIPTPFHPDGVYFYGDFNGDGHDDILVQGMHQGDTSYIFLNDGTDKYRSINQSITGNYLGQYWTADVSNLYIGDFNGDGRDDIIVESVAVGGTNSMLYATTSGTFDNLYVTWENLGSGGSYTTVAGSTAGAFEVSNTGAATYSIPLIVPPGTASMEPSLSLNYSSQGGNGLVGMGWSLGGLSVIHRCPATQVQDGFRGSIKFDSNDRFCLDGQRLIAISGAYGANGTEYRAEINTFSRIKSYGAAGSGPAYFIVETKAGQKIEYGNTADSRIEAQGKSSALLWAVNKIQDKLTNYATFQYVEDNANGEYFPSRIDYTGNTAAGSAPTRSVLFSYATRSTDDRIQGYINGSKVSTSKLLTNIKTYIKSALTSDELIKDYQLSFEQGPSTKRLRLIRVKECSDNECFNPTSIIWQDPGNSFYSTLNSSTFTPTSVANWTPYTGDVNGDGKEDLIFGSGTNWQIARSNPNGTSTNDGKTFSVVSLPNLANSSNQVFFEDVDGDGDDDMVTKSGTNLIVYLSNGISSFGAAITTSSSATTFKAYPADINGDGRQDFILKYEGTSTSSGNYTMSLAISNGNGTFTNGSFSISPELSGQNLINWKLYPIDISGDGKTDIVLKDKTTNNVVTYLSNGNNTFTRVLNKVALSPTTTDNYELYPADLNGDGAMDLIAVKPNSNTVQTLISKGDGTFYQAYSTTAFATTSISGYLPYPGDINGDGRTDIIFKNTVDNNVQTFASKGDGAFFQANNFSPSGTTGWITLPTDISGDGKVDLVFKYPSTNEVKIYLAKDPVPDLANNFFNGLGAEIKPTYKPITASSVYNKIGGTVQGGERFYQGPMHVVSQVQTSNGINGYHTTTYMYFGAKINLDGRGFLGFYDRRVTDGDTGIIVTTGYRQDFPFIGLVRLSITQSLPNMNQTVITTWNSITTNTKVYFPYVQSSSESTYDLNNTWIRSSTATNSVPNTWGDSATTTTTTQDSYGTYTTLTTNTFAAVDTTNWILSRLIQSTVKNTLPDTTNATRKSTFAYAAGTGLLLTETIEPGTTLEQKTEYTYDAFGNSKTVKVTGYTMPSRTTSITYGHDGAYPITIANPLGQKEYRVHDARFGEVTQLLGPNGLLTTWSYDDLGRKLREDRTDGNYTTWSYSDCISCLPNSRYMMTASVSGAGSTTVYYDVLGREIRSEGTVNGSPVYQDKEYDSKGQLSRETLPYYPSGTKYWTTYTYDELGRPLTTTTPDSIVSQYEYNGLITTTQADKNGKNQINNEWKNALGQVVKVQDNNNFITQYTYDPFGNLLKVIDPMGNEIRNTYDIRGRKLTSRDPDMGTWSYTYNALGELITQTDAKNQQTRMEYDLLGRMTKRTDAYGTSGAEVSQWVYDTAPGKGIGKLATVTGINGYQRSYAYDNLGRTRESTSTILSSNYTITYDYDAFSRISTVTYPQGNSSRFTTRNIYDTNGYLKRVENASNGLKYWEAITTNALGQITKERFGNNLDTINNYNAQTGRLEAITTGATGGVQSAAYVYDSLGNLTRRSDASLVYNGTPFNETFSYDNLNRLTVASSSFYGTVKWNYNAIGNITCSTKLGTSTSCNTLTATNYTYPISGTNSVRPHAVAAAGSNSYSYDTNGNMINGAGRSFTYTSYNIPANLTQGSKFSTFQYNPDRARIVQTSSDSTTYYLDPSPTGSTLYSKEFKGGVTSHIYYIYAGTGMVGTYTERSNATTATRYFHKDHLGSIDAITNESGAVVERLSYDVFGDRRVAPCSSTFCMQMSNITHHGFTGHEHIDEVGLIHMNGRVYDPKLGRFLSADPNVQAPMNAQSLNRYSYVLNNPLSLTDPSGYNWFSDRWHDVKRDVSNAWKDWGRTVAAAVIAYYTGQWAGNAAWAAQASTQAGVATASAYSASAMASSVAASASFGASATALYGGSGTDVINAAIKGGASGIASGMATAPFVGQWNYGRVVANGISGGLRAEMYGGEFKDGFKYGSLTSLMRLIYNKAVGYDTTWQQGGDAREKQLDTLPYVGRNNIGTAGKINQDSWWGEGGRISRALNIVPGVNAVSGLHDIFQVRLGDGLLRDIFNAPGMPLAAIMTYAGLLNNSPHMINIYYLNKDGSED